MNSFESNEFLHLHKTYGGFRTKRNTCIDTKNAIKQDSVSKQVSIKKTSIAKKTIAHRIEAQFDELCRTHLDKKRNGFVARKKAAKQK